MAEASGRRVVKLEDVAARVGLSAATVSLVLRDQPGPSTATRQRILQAAAELSYRPDRTASILARRKSHLLGVLIDIRSPFHAELVDDLQQAADERGYDLVLSTITRTRCERRAIETLVDFRCEALILLGPETPVPELITLDEQHPVVVIGRRITGGSVDVVRTADDRGVAAAVDHLIGLGHTDIAFVDGGPGTIAADRRRGYRTAMRRHGLADRLRTFPGDHTEEAGITAAQAILAQPGTTPTAIIAFNDQSALGLVDRLSRAGWSIPEDLSVVGYDDTPLARLAHINLTTVSQDAHWQAERAVEAAFRRLEHGRGQPRDMVHDPTLVVRGTTAPPAHRTS
jgi:DNA-binding LacI/PurR family transcriptional regulator